MKNVALFLLTLFSLTFFNVNAQTQNVSYNPSTAIFANPERGLQKYSKNVSSDGNYDAIDQSEITGWKTGTDKVTVIYRYLMLGQFMNSSIDDAYLANVQTDFNRIRNAGLKVIIRPTYTTNYVNNVQPNKAQILVHITQLANVINANKDVIISIQGGFIGVYGEWYYTGGDKNDDTDGSPEFGDKGNISNEQWLNRKDVVDAMLANFNSSIPLQVRSATAKRKMYGDGQLTDVTAYQNTALARVGFYNDAFLNNYGDMGTYDVSGGCTNPVGTADFNFIANAGQYIPMNGETNGFNPCDSGLRTTGANAVVELNALNFSTLNRDYFTGAWDNWIASGHYNQIVRNLGYRLQLNSTTVNVGTTIDFTMNISNVGFANVVSAKNVYLVFRSTTGTEYKKLLNVDPRLWKTTHSYSQSLPKDIPAGQYSLYLHIADPNLESRNEYSIRLANSDVAFETTTGYNNLNQTIIIASTVSCTSTTTWNGTTWSNGLPSETKNVIINGNYVTVINGSFDCCNLTINNTYSLIINQANFVTVQNHIENLGILIVQSGGKLIPVNDTSTSNGDVSVQRGTTSMSRFDYTYWGSPVSTTVSQALGSWQPGYTFEFFTPNFSDVNTVYPNGTTILGTPDGQDDEAPAAWIASSGNMTAGKGYASMIRSTPSFGTYPRSEIVTFTGDLNTGIINCVLNMSGNIGNNDDDFNLVSNPYSSSIRANDFINENLPNISGTIAYWTHVGTLSNLYPGLGANSLNFSTADYAYYNLLGGTASSATGGNPSGFGGGVPTSAIGSCQGFLVEAENNANLVFKPSFMDKVVDNTTDVVFFRNNNETKRLWLSLNSELGLFSQQLIGYNSNTTLNFEKGWDFKEKTANQVFYSIENDIKYKIQGRGEFDINDIVKLGYKTIVVETYTIKLDGIEGIENIFIKDNGVLHTLPYTFTTEAGEFNDRFELVYQESSLGTNPIDVNHGLVLAPNPATNKVEITFKELNDNPIMYNILGERISIDYKIEDNQIIYNIDGLSKGLYFIRINDITLKFIKK